MWLKLIYSILIDVFIYNIYIGSINVRTHCKARVVNRASRFHKSAGIDDMDHPRTERHSPILSGSPGSTTGKNFDIWLQKFTHSHYMYSSLEGQSSNTVPVISYK